MEDDQAMSRTDRPNNRGRPRGPMAVGGGSRRPGGTKTKNLGEEEQQHVGAF